MKLLRLVSVVLAVSLGACQSTGVEPAVDDFGAFMVFFASDSAELTDQSKATIAEAADAIRRRKNRTVSVIGTTDGTGPAAYNIALGQKRAMAVKDELVRRGIDPASIKAWSKGANEPLVVSKAGAAEWQNRSVWIVGE